MGEPHCAICALMGYRTCNLCGGGIVVFPHPLLGDVCEFCLADHGHDDDQADDDTPDSSRPA